MIRVTKITDYGIAMMTHMADQEKGTQVTAPAISEDTGLPLPTVRKILKILTRNELLASTRGISGGYSLARAPEEISLLDMVCALEGPVAVTECATGEPCGCDRGQKCALQENWSLVNNLIERTLKTYNLAQMRGNLGDIPVPEIVPQIRG